jgi:chromosome segregation and condensation protein ScpB
LAAVIPDDSNLDLLIADVRDELRTRPYDIVSVAGIYQHRTPPAYAAVIRGAGAVGSPRITLSPLEQLALTVIAYFQPVMLGKPVSRVRRSAIFCTIETPNLPGRSAASLRQVEWNRLRCRCAART